MTENNGQWTCRGVKNDGTPSPIKPNHPIEVVDGDICPQCQLHRHEVVTDKRKPLPLGKILGSLSAVAIVLLLGFGAIKLLNSSSSSSASRRPSQLRGDSFEHAHDSAVSNLALSPDGQTLFTSGADTAIKIWDLNGQTLSGSFDGHQGRVNSLAMAPQGAFLASGGGDGTVRVWNLTTNSQVKALSANQEGQGANRVLSVAVSADDKYIAAGTDAGLIYVWDTNTYDQVAAFRNASESHPIQDIAFDPTKPTRLAVARDGGSLDVWEFIPKGNSKLIYPLNDDTNRVFSVAISPDGKTLASGNYEGEIILWDMATGREIRTLATNGHKFIVSSLNFSKDGKYLVSSGYDETVCVWDYLSSGDPHIQSIREHSGFVYDAMMTPDNTTIVSSGLDTSIQITDLQESENQEE
jgi:WD40 repeat protein